MNTKQIDMQAVILASGIGSRIKKITNDIPKALIPINDIPIIGRQIKQLLDANIEEIIITTGYQSHKIQEYINCEFPDIDVKYIYNDRYNTTNYIYSYLANMIYEFPLNSYSPSHCNFAHCALAHIQDLQNYFDFVQLGRQFLS